MDNSHVYNVNIKQYYVVVYKLGGYANIVSILTIDNRS